MGWVAPAPLVANTFAMLILASASPRRRELLTAAGLEHTVAISHIPESRLPLESPEAYVMRVAEEKARAIVSAESDVVLGADTIVCLNGDVLGKPADRTEAVEMLRALSGRKHRVLTAICLRRGTHLIRDMSETWVWFENISDAEVSEYVATGESMDKAGGYGIQGYASRFVKRIEGCYHNVVGLPVSLVYRHLKSI
jgi:septum formation protein